MFAVDKQYCMSSFLLYRAIADTTKSFAKGVHPNFFTPPAERFYIKNVDDIERTISAVIKSLNGEPCALMLSGGIDSAIVAKYLPKGTVCYTLKCLAEGALDETRTAARYAEECGLVHKVVEVSWEDYNNFLPTLMKHKGAPVHSIEPQIYKAALRAREDGIENLLFGESADEIFGGLDGLLAKDWTFDEFIARYTYLNPADILKDGLMITEPFEKYRIGEGIDFYHFLCDYYYGESNGSYDNACSVAGIKYIAPFNRMILDVPLDYARNRAGEPKYMLREIFKKLYGTSTVPKKTPMPRAVSQWLADWAGPVREEFRDGCANGLSGDQKWMVYVLEKFLNMIEPAE